MEGWGLLPSERLHGVNGRGAASGEQTGGGDAASELASGGCERRLP